MNEQHATTSEMQETEDDQEYKDASPGPARKCSHDDVKEMSQGKMRGLWRPSKRKDAGNSPARIRCTPNSAGKKEK